MSSQISKFIHESLASAGFAVLSSSIAYSLRRDLWSSGMDAGGDFATRNWRNSLGQIADLKRFRARLAGLDRDVEVVTRSADALEQRIQWVTGREVLSLVEEGAPVAAAPEPKVKRANSETAPVRRIVELGDLYPGVLTREPGRTCHGCENLSAGHTCKASVLSGVEVPLMREPRRCLGYVPPWASIDGRTGRVLWPELENRQPINASEKGRA
jgi:hypothetical protein